jgi:hypothetical protein
VDLCVLAALEILAQKTGHDLPYHRDQVGTVVDLLWAELLQAAPELDAGDLAELLGGVGYLMVSRWEGEAQAAGGA